MHHFYAGAVGEAHVRQVTLKALAGVRHHDLSWILFRVRKNVRNALERRRRIGDQHIRHRGDQGDRHEVLRRLIGHPRVDLRGDDLHRERGDHQRVAIRCRPRHHFRGDDSAGTGLVHHHELLLQDLRETQGEQSGEHVIRDADRIRDDDLDRSRGIRVLGGPNRDRARHGCAKRKACNRLLQIFHSCLL
ncbi:hypothetical protein D3C71_1588320 [compost metagenome]